MSNPTVQASQAARRWLIVATTGVLLWRAAALRWPSSLVSIPDGLRLPIALLGVLFLLCGFVAWKLRPGRFTTLLLLYGVGAGVHWGGTIGVSNSGLELSLLFVYLGFSALAEAAFLHLALIYPIGGSIARGGLIVLYAPATIAWLVAAIAWAAPTTFLGGVSAVVLLTANLFSVLAAVVLLIRLVRADQTMRRAARLPLVVASVWTAGILAELGARSVLPGQPEAWNLLLGAIPICLVFALVSQTASGSEQSAHPNT